MKVALIDEAFNNEAFIAGLREDVSPIYVTPDDTYMNIINKIRELPEPVTNVVIAQHLNSEGLKLGCENLALYNDDSTWGDLKMFLTKLKALGVETVDFLACLLYGQPGVPEMFSALEEVTGIDLRASTDNTGNIEVGGNWILESDMADIEGLYFTAAISEFKELFYANIFDKTYNFTKNMFDVSGNTIYAYRDISGYPLFPPTDASGNNYILNLNSASSTYMGQTSYLPTGYTANGSVGGYKQDNINMKWASATYNSGYGIDINGGVQMVNNSSYNVFPTGQRAIDLSAGVIDIVKTYNSSTLNVAYAALKSDGTVIVWGPSGFGGDDQSYGSAATGGSAANAWKAKPSTLSNVKCIYANNAAFAALKKDKTVVCWGQAQYGGTDISGGSGGTAWKAMPAGLSNVVSIATTQGAFAALKSDGTVVCWGYAQYGGYDTTISTTSVGLLDISGVARNLNNNIKAVYGNLYNFLAHKTDNTVFGWGYATATNYGIGTLSLMNYTSTIISSITVSKIYPVSIGYYFIKTNGSISYSVTGTFTTPTGLKLTDLTTANTLKELYPMYGYGYGFAALKTDGTVIAAGGELYGGFDLTYAQTATSTQYKSKPTDLSNVTYIAAAYGSYAAFTTSRKVIVWGNKQYGGGDANDAFFVGSTTYSGMPTDLSNVVVIQGGFYGFTAITTNGKLYRWGYKSTSYDMSGGNVLSGYAYQLNSDNYLISNVLSTGTLPLYNRIYAPTGGMYQIPRSYINIKAVDGATLGSATITINNPFGGNVSLVINGGSPISLSGTSITYNANIPNSEVLITVTGTDDASNTISASAYFKPRNITFNCIALNRKVAIIPTIYNGSNFTIKRSSDGGTSYVDASNITQVGTYYIDNDSDADINYTYYITVTSSTGNVYSSSTKSIITYDMPTDLQIGDLTTAISATSWFDRSVNYGSRYQSLYTASELSSLGIGANSVISALSLFTTGMTVTGTANDEITNFSIRLKNVTISTLTPGTTGSASMVSDTSGCTLVYSATRPVRFIKDWNIYSFDTPFTYTGNNLLVEIIYSNSTLNSSAAISLKVMSSTIPSIIAYNEISATNVNNLLRLTGVSTSSFSYKPVIQFRLGTPTVSSNKYSYLRFIITHTWGTTGSCTNLGDMYIYSADATNNTYPPRRIAITDVTRSSDTYNVASISNATYANGQYIIRSSTTGYSLYPWYVLDGAVTGTTIWNTEEISQIYTTDASGAYAGIYSQKTYVNGQAISGEWIEIKFPTPITASSVAMTNMDGTLRRFADGMTIVGSNDGMNWSIINEYAYNRNGITNTLVSGTTYTSSIALRPSITSIVDGINLGTCTLSVNTIINTYKYTVYRNGSILNDYVDVSSSTVTVPADSTSIQSFYAICTKISDPSIVVTTNTVTITPRVPSLIVVSSLDGKAIITPTLYNGTNIIIERSLNNVSFDVITPIVNGSMYIDDTAITGTTYYYRIKASSSTGVQLTSAAVAVTISTLYTPPISILYPNFSSTTGLTLLGNYSLSGDILFMTKPNTYEITNIYLNNVYKFNSSFSINWNMEIGGGTGYDGFCLQWAASKSLGTAGSSVGMILDSSTLHAIRFNTGTGNNTISWYKNNALQTSTTTTSQYLRQNLFYWLDYNHYTQTCAIYINTTNSKPASAYITFNNFIFDTNNYYFGMGAATGGSADNHILKSLNINKSGITTPVIASTTQTTLGEVILNIIPNGYTYTIYKNGSAVSNYINSTATTATVQFDNKNAHIFYLIYNNGTSQRSNNISVSPIYPVITLKNDFDYIKLIPSLYNGTLVSIERSTDNSGFAVVTLDSIGGNYADSSVVLNTTYYYRINVSAYNNPGLIFTASNSIVRLDDAFYTNSMYNVDINNGNYVLSAGPRVYTNPTLTHLYHTTYAYTLNYTPTTNTLLRFFNGATEMTLTNTPTGMIKYLDAANNTISDPVTNVANIKTIKLNNKILYNYASPFFATSALYSAATYLSTISYKGTTITGGNITYESLPTYPYYDETSTGDEELFGLIITGENETSINFDSTNIPPHKSGGNYRNNKGLKDALHEYVELAAGKEYTLTTNLGSIGSSYTSSVATYIDYNANGVFTDASELIGSVTNFSSVVAGINKTMTFTVPETALLNKLMRIRIVYNEINTIPVSAGSLTYGSIYDFSARIVSGSTPITLDAVSQTVKVYKNTFDPNYSKRIDVSANGGSGSLSYAWSGAGVVYSSNNYAYVKYRQGVSGETITVTVSSTGVSNVTKTFNIQYVEPPLITNFATTIPNDEYRVTSDGRLVANVTTGIVGLVGTSATIGIYTPPSGQGIDKLAAKIVETTSSNGVATLIFDIDKYKADGTKVESVLGTTATYGTFGFDISANRVFSIAWKHPNGQIYIMAKYDPSGTPTIITYNSATLTVVNTSNGRSYFNYFGPNSQSFINSNPPGVTALPCFVAGTRILTPTGEKLIESLKTGDIILTADGRKVPAMIYSTHVPATTETTAPYHIPANAFRANYPPCNITLSPKHAIQSAKGVWQIPQFAAERFPAIQKTSIGESVTYYHIELPNYFTDNLVANGSICESLGSKAQKNLPKGQSLYTFNKKAGGFIRYNPAETKSLSKH